MSSSGKVPTQRCKKLNREKLLSFKVLHLQQQSQCPLPARHARCCRHSPIPSWKLSQMQLTAHCTEDSPKHKFVVHMSSSRKHRHFLHMLLAALSWNAWETYLKESVLKLVAHIPSPFSPAFRMLWANQRFRSHSIRTQKAHRRSITQPRSIKHVVKPAVRSK